MNDDEQRKLALQLRGELDSVIADAGEREALLVELDAALALHGPEGGRQLADVLRQHQKSREWMLARDPDAVDTDRLTQLAGDPSDLGMYFVCPKQDFDFVRDHVNDVVPLCPTHKVPLVPVPE